MNYIFLDIDGVMNNQDDWLNKAKNNLEGFKDHKMFCDKAWELLSQLCKTTGAKIILSSSWRLSFSMKGNEVVLRNKECNWSQKLLDYFKKYEIEVVGLTTNFYDHRGKQIIEYVKYNLFLTDKWVVLDDEICDIEGYVPEEQLFKTEFETGLLEEHCEKIKEYFMKGE
jgi:hypothetical protein